MAEVRVELAKRAITARRGSVESIADQLGFSDASAFRRAFKRHTGMTPAEFAAGQRG